MTTSDVDAGSTSSSCYCPCTLSLASSTITTEELQAKIEQMQTELTVNRKETSSYKRKLTSAPDDRVSAKSIGYVGVVILTVVTGLLVCIDLPTIMKDSLAFFKRCHSYCCKKWYFTGSRHAELFFIKSSFVNTKNEIFRNRRNLK